MTRHEVAALQEVGPQQDGETKAKYLTRIRAAWWRLEMADPGDSRLEEAKTAQDGIDAFHKDIQKIQFRRCAQCSVRPLEAKGAAPDGHLCLLCAKERAAGGPFLRSHANFYKPRRQPEALVNLTLVEELLISRVWAVVNVFKARGGQDMYGGHVIAFPRSGQVCGCLCWRLPQSITRVRGGAIAINQAPLGSLTSCCVRDSSPTSWLRFCRTTRMSSRPSLWRVARPAA